MTEHKQLMWLKLHLMVGVKTNIVTSVEVSDGYAHDYPFFKGLVDRTADAGFKMKEVSADKGYLGGRICWQHCSTARSLTFRLSQTQYRTHAAVMAQSRNYGPACIFYALNRAEFLQHYHKRSNVETTFHMIKSKFGQRLRSRSLTAQINEALCKVLCHNLCVVIQSVHELGIETNFEAARES